MPAGFVRRVLTTRGFYPAVAPEPTRVATRCRPPGRPPGRHAGRQAAGRRRARAGRRARGRRHRRRSTGRHPRRPRRRPSTPSTRRGPRRRSCAGTAVERPAFDPGDVAHGAQVLGGRADVVEGGIGHRQADRARQLGDQLRVEPPDGIGRDLRCQRRERLPLGHLHADEMGEGRASGWPRRCSHDAGKRPVDDAHGVVSGTSRDRGHRHQGAAPGVDGGKRVQVEVGERVAVDDQEPIAIEQVEGTARATRGTQDRGSHE